MFNDGYPVQNARDKAAITVAFRWLASVYPTPAVQPTVRVVHHDHMQSFAIHANHKTRIRATVMAMYSQQKRTVFVSDRLHPSRHIKDAAIVVHELVHHFQTCNGKVMSVVQMEREADVFMLRFLRECHAPVSSVQ